MGRRNYSSGKLLVLTIATAASLIGAVLSPAVRAADQPQTENGYAYKVENGKATITAYYGGGGGDILIVPSEIGGYPVTTIGNGVQTAFSNGNPGVFLIPDSVTRLSNRAIYDYNSTYYISIPAGAKIEDGATSSIAIASIAGREGSPAQSYARQVGIGFTSEVVTLKAEAGAGGKMSISGNYLIPKKLQRSYNLNFQIKADSGCQIQDVQVNGVGVTAARGQSAYTLQYTLQAQNSQDILIEASFAPGAGASAGQAGEKAAAATSTYEFPDNGTSAGRYANAIGICAGNFYATVKDGKTVVYKLVKSYTSKDGSIKFRSSDELKNYAADRGLTYGKDYDYFHVYNYNEGSRAYYVAYLYKTYNGPMTGVDSRVGSLEAAQADFNAILDISSLFAQNKAELTLKDWTFSSFSNYYGPVEGTNFFGADSAILADSEATINLINPSLNGSANIAFATYKGIVNITDGSLVGTTQGAHGVYVANGGKITLNAADADPAKGVEPALAKRPDPDKGYIVRDKATQDIKVVNNLDPGYTTLITAHQTGTVLATDSGGGTIIANKTVGKSYGQGSGGVYSIGSNDGLVWVYNSTLTANMDAGIVSASGGYVYAHNSVIQGLMGIKLRAGQNSTKMSEVRLKNCELIAFFDKDEMERLFDVVTPEQQAAAQKAGTKTNAFTLSLFGRNFGGSSSSTTQNSWFDDGYYKTPGGMGGSVFSVIYTEGSKTPIYIESTRLFNKNYAKYKDAPGSKAQNIIIDAEGNGTAVVFFINNNSKTRWDLTGVSQETTEITGDFNVSDNTQSLEQRMMGGSGGMPPQSGMPSGTGGSGMPGGIPGGEGGMPGGGEGGGMSGGEGGSMPGGMPPQSGMPGGTGGEGGMPGGMGGPGGMDSGTKGNFINATFQNSEWTGTVIGVSKNASLNFDEKSSWKVTAGADIDTLTVAPGTTIIADKPVKITVAKLVVAGNGSYKAGRNVTIETRKEETREDAK